MARIYTLALLFTAVLAGCSGPVPEAADDAGPLRFERAEAPFVIQDAEGTPYAFPTLGGFNVPRPQFVDVDLDGDLDLFVQEYAGEVIFFENIGAADDPQFTFVTEHFLGLDVGEWFRFADLDGDGDPDLLAEERYSYVRAYRNETTDGGPLRFELFTDTLLTASGEPLFADRQNILNVTDLDADDHLDLFLGRVDGTVSRYEATEEQSAEGLARFRLVAERFAGIEIVGQVGQPGAEPVVDPMQQNIPGGNLPGGSLHGANTLAFADVDDDGDPDLLWGDFFEPGLLLIENTGTTRRPNFRTPPQLFPPDNPVTTTGYNAPTLGDLDGDGDLDLLVGVLGGAFDANRSIADNLLYYEDTGDGYELRTERFLDMLDVGSESVPAFGDLDGDGDLDLLLANKRDAEDGETARVYRLENVGTDAAPTFRLGEPLDLPDTYHYTPELADLDADGDVDLLLGTWKGHLLLARGEGGTFAAPDTLFELPRGGNAYPALADVDGDGDLDLVVGEASGQLSYYQNVGTPEAPRFELVQGTFEGVDLGRRSAPAFADLDEDGDADLLVGSEAEGVHVFLNEGVEAGQPRFRDAGPLDVLAPDLAAPALADLDGDGDLDLVMGGSGGGLVYFEQP